MFTQADFLGKEYSHARVINHATAPVTGRHDSERGALSAASAVASSDPLLARELLSTVNQAVSALDDVERELVSALAVEEEEHAAATSTFQRHLADVSLELRDLAEDLDHIQKRVHVACRAADPVIEEVNQLHQEKQHARDANAMLRFFFALNGGLDAQLTDLPGDSIQHAALLLKKLRQMSDDLDDEKTARGRAAVEKCCEELERKLVSDFVLGIDSGDMAKSKRHALALHHFNGARNLPAIFIQRLNLFRSDAADVSTIDEFQSVLDTALGTCRREVGVICRVFPNPPNVIAQLWTRVLEQHVHQLLYEFLDMSSPAYNSYSSTDKLGLWLKRFDESQQIVASFADSLAEIYKPCPVSLDQMLETILSEHMEEYVDREMRWLAQQYRAELKDLNTEERTFDGDYVLRASELSIGFVHKSSESVRRCTGLRTGKKAPEAMCAIFGALQRYLIEQLIGGLLSRSVIQFPPSADQAGLTANLKNIASAAAAKTARVAGGGGDALAAVQETHARTLPLYFDSLQHVNQMVVLFEQHFHHTILPNLLESERDRLKVIMEKKEAVLSLEKSINQAMSRALNLMTSCGQTLLEGHRDRNDYNISESSMDHMMNPTSAARHCVDFFRQICHVIRSSLDGKNLAVVQDHVSSSVFELVLEHIKHQQISLGLGGMRVMCDVMLFVDLQTDIYGASSGKKHSKLNILKDVANIFIVAADTLETLVPDSQLAQLPQEEVMGLINKREDMRKGMFSSLASFWDRQ